MIRGLRTAGLVWKSAIVLLVVIIIGLSVIRRDIYSSVVCQMQWITFSDSTVQPLLASSVAQLDDKNQETLMNLTARQTLHFASGLELYIHGAFLDERFDRNVVRIFALRRQNSAVPDFMCRWRANTGKLLSEVPAITQLLEYFWPAVFDYFAVSYNCFFTNKSSRPDEIEFISTNEKYVFLITVEKSVCRKKRKQMAICIKPVLGSLETTRLIEWFEIQHALGIRDILLYTTSMTGTAPYVVQYYEDLGLVQTIPFPYLMSVAQILDKGPMDGQARYALYQKLLLIGLQDCLYRFYASYENLLILDLDEVLLPSPQHKDLGSMLHYLHKYSPSNSTNFLFQTAWHFEDYGVTDDIPDIFYMLRMSKASEPTDLSPKSIIVTDRAVFFNFHSVMMPGYRHTNVHHSSVGHLHHFRGLCAHKFNKTQCDKLNQTQRYDPVLAHNRMTVMQNMIGVQTKLQLH